jgi:threonylcarbamoyladenosine tRNA methylthiotransferase CDKAL1
MRVSIYNLHSMCENNTLFLSRARRYFLLNGHTVLDGAGEADLVFVGGCAVTDTMRARCEGTVLESMRQLPRARFVVFGCLAAFPEGLQAAAGRDADRLHIVPYREGRRLDELIRARIPFDKVSVNRLERHVPYQPGIGPDDSYVLIAQGCVNDCSYCNIKKAKGDVVSRSEETIEAEVRDLYGSGIRTMTLLADDCGSYGLDRGSDLPELLTRLSRVAPDLRYRLYTVFPPLFLQYFSRLEPFFAERRVPFLCLPVQSAARRVLGLMNRRYDPDHLAGAVARLRALDPEALVYSHFIFNFPTETWDEFEKSVAFARHFDHSVFIGYGENKGRPAAGLFPKCGNEALEAKARRIGELVRRGELAAFVVPTP